MPTRGMLVRLLSMLAGRAKAQPVYRNNAVYSSDDAGVGAAAEKRQSQMLSHSRSASHSRRQIAWFDYAKGICIILVVMMHSTLGVEKLYGAEGFMHYVISYAKPFRMPDFFFLSALFLPLAMPRSWLHYLDKKVLHFAYFYLLWLVILVVFKSAGKGELSAANLGGQFYDALIGPYSALWFIYVLPLFFIVTKALDRLPGWLLFVSAAVLQLGALHTGWQAIDEFFVHYYVFFVAGYLLSPHVFELAEKARNRVPLALLVVAAWALINGILAFTPSPFARWETMASLPIVAIALGLAGAVAITIIAALLAKFEIGSFVRFCGRHSIVLYLSFTIPMSVTRLIQYKLQLVSDPGLAALITWLVAVSVPLGVYLVLKRTPLRFLYERPAWLALPYQRQQSVPRSSVNPAKPAGLAGSAGSGAGKFTKNPAPILAE